MALDRFAPTRPQRAACHLVHVDGGLYAFRVGKVRHAGGDVLHHHVVVHGQSDEQVVNGQASSARLLTWNVKVIGFDVAQLSLNVPQTIVSGVAVVGHDSGVGQFAVGGGWKSQLESFKLRV